MQVKACSDVMMQLLREQGPVVLDNLTIPKFSKIFVLLVKLDNAGGNSTVNNGLK